MRASIAPLLVIAVLLAGSGNAGAEEPRQLVVLPPMMQAHMLANMRDHLATLADIQAALGAGDLERAADLAETRLGMSSLAVHEAAHMAPFMPEAMQEIGTEMHRAASRFAVAAQDAGARGDLRPALAALAEVTQRCVACHAGFRAH